MSYETKSMALPTATPLSWDLDLTISKHHRTSVTEFARSSRDWGALRGLNEGAFELCRVPISLVYLLIYTSTYGLDEVEKVTKLRVSKS